MRREWIEMPYPLKNISQSASPSMRREWIEIENMYGVLGDETVSLHAEGVD